MFVRTVTGVLAILIASVSLQAQQDPVMGTWKLNLAKSKYSPGPPPRSRILILEPLGSNGIKLVNDAVLANGEKTHTEETFINDGKEHRITRSADADTHINRQIDAYTSETVTKKGDKIVQTLRRIVSRDGKTLTITVKGTTASGAPLDDVRVFDKQ